MSRKWAEVEAEALRWRETGDKRLLEGLIQKLMPFAERKIRARLAGKRLHDHLDLLGHEIRSAALFAVWRALQTWRPELSSLAHYLALYCSGFAGRLLTKVRLDHVSLSDPVGEDKEQTWEDVLPADVPEPEEALVRKGLQEALAGLPERHREALKRRLQGQTLAEIAQEFGLSRESIRRLEAEALVRLKGGAMAFF